MDPGSELFTRVFGILTSNVALEVNNNTVQCIIASKRKTKKSELK